MKRLLIAAAVALLAGAAAPSTAQEAPAAPARPSVLDQAVNGIHVSSYNVYGPGQTHAIVESSVQGGRALRVDVATAGANPWDVGAGSVTTKPVRNGDVLLLAVWLRAERLPAGAETARVNVRLQEAAAPYAEIGSADVRVGPEWKMYFAQGVATRDYAPGAAGATIQLASASQAIDLGPVFILDFGPDYDRTTLPTN
ncbi:MAG: hypothetical protein ACK4VY_09560 [Brevundimonas sp.]